MKKLSIVVAVLLVIAAFAYSQRGTIAKRIMSRGVDMVMGTDTLAELGDGLHVTICGAGMGHLVYYHVVPPLVFPGAESAWLGGVDEVFTNYTLSRDGTSFTLPPNSKEIIRTKDKI